MINFKRLPWLNATETPMMLIGIEGLSLLARQLQAERPYIVAVDNCQSRQHLLLSTVHSVLGSGLSCAVVSPDPEKLSSTLQTTGLQPNRQSLLLLKQQPDTKEHLQNYGCKRFLLELEEAGIRTDSLLIVEVADDFFNWHHADQLKAQIQHYRRWLKSWRIAGLFMTAQSVWQPQTHLTRLSEQFSGVAEFRKDLGGYRWAIKHWYSSHGVLEEADYEVRRDDNGLTLEVVDSESDSGADYGQVVVYYTVESVAGDESVPDDWVPCPGYQEVLAFGARLRQATVVLDYRQPASFPLLAQTVHQLRYLAGRQMRIVIRERGGQLRYSQELLLTRLGANQVVYMEFGVSRLLRVVESVAGLRFTGFIEADFDQALAAAMPSEECGYLPAGRFCEVVKSSLHKTEAIDMHHVLVRLDILPEVAHVDVLLNCQPRRANDVVTADESHIYVFLFACREADIASALARIINQPLELMFSGQSYWSGRHNILAVLDGLHERFKLTSMADFSLLLPASGHHAVAVESAVVSSVAAQNQPLSTVFDTQAKAVSAVPAPRRVVQQPLKLRS